MGQSYQLAWFWTIGRLTFLKIKKVFINFYKDWFVYCRKMDQAAIRNPMGISMLNTDYYAVRISTETADWITFGDTTEHGYQYSKLQEIFSKNTRLSI